MPIFFKVLNLMLPLILISFAGFVLAKLKKFNTQTFSDMIIYLTAPALFIVSLSTNSFETKELLTIILTSFLTICLSALFVWILKKRMDIPLGFYLPVIFMNSGFIGLPLILMMFGAEGLARAIVYDVVNGLLIFSLGIYIISNKKDRFEIFKTPILYAAVIGILINYLKITIPYPIQISLSMVGSITIPLALITLGYQLGKIKIRTIKLPIFGAAIRLAFGLFIAFSVIKLFNVRGELANILVIMSALPSALNGIVLSEKYRKEDSDVIASTIAISILASIIYLPIIISLIKCIQSKTS
ncbi:AEC family transporter [Candidatus Saganbacteria bacterium]|nr:AEC family transporter [Candidatus Saganbacteria bacterium]